MSIEHYFEACLELLGEMNVMKAGSRFGGKGEIAFFAFKALNVIVFAIFLHVLTIAIRAKRELRFFDFFLFGMNFLELLDELGLFLEREDLEGCGLHGANIIINLKSVKY